MITFEVYDNGQRSESVLLRNAYMIGSDGHPVQAEISFVDRQIVCRKRESGAVALALQRDVGACGELTVKTCLLPERDRPYLLNLELARNQLMMLYNKLEDWGMFEISTEHRVTKRLDAAKQLFMQAVNLQRDNPAEADKLAKDALVIAVDGSEELALAHSELLLAKRKRAGMVPKHPIGCGVTLGHEANQRLRTGLQADFDFVYLPTPWRTLAPEEGRYDWSQTDEWAEWISRNRVPAIAGPVISFDPRNVPSWLFIWEHDFDMVRDMIYEHTERVVTRYRNAITSWNVVSGLHLNSHFMFRFEQLLDLTRTTTMLVKKIQPAARSLVEIRQPFGEYFGSDQRSIAPLMYADLLIQSNVSFDGFVVKILMGQPEPGQYTRDLMQLSVLLDQFNAFDKQIHVRVGVPSQTVVKPPTPNRRAEDTKSASTRPLGAGHWRKPWSPTVQSHWLEAIFQIAMSKPLVESVGWYELLEHKDTEMAHLGLLNEKMQPNEGFVRLRNFRKNLLDTSSSWPTSDQSVENSNAHSTAGHPG